MERILPSPHFTVIADFSGCRSLCGFTCERCSSLIQHFPHKIKATVKLIITLCPHCSSILFLKLGILDWWIEMFWVDVKRHFAAYFSCSLTLNASAELRQVCHRVFGFLCLWRIFKVWQPSGSPCSLNDEQGFVTSLFTAGHSWWNLSVSLKIWWPACATHCLFKSGENWVCGFWVNRVSVKKIHPLQMEWKWDQISSFLVFLNESIGKALETISYGVALWFHQPILNAWQEYEIHYHYLNLIKFKRSISTY